MKRQSIKIFIFATALFFSVTFLLPANTNAQRRDYFTVEEIELVRDANEIDLRIAVLIRAIERRMLVVNNDTSQSKQVTKDEGKWGALPTGTRLELLSDISKIFEKAIDDIDDLADRQAMNSKTLKGTVENEVDQDTQRVLKANEKKFPLAVHNLADASRRLLPLFETLKNNSKDEKEIGVLLKSIESCEMIIEASAQVARPVDKKGKN
jgi:hypothetical protein